MATEEADDLAHVNKLRSALESVDHKRRKVTVDAFELSLIHLFCIIIHFIFIVVFLGQAVGYYCHESCEDCDYLFVQLFVEGLG